MLRRGFVNVGGGQVHYRTAGVEGAPKLVMFHGSPGGSFSLVPLVEQLGHHFHVFALDTRGNGDSTPHSLVSPEIADYALAHLEAIDALGIDRCSLYGFHTGTAIATEVSLARPDLVDRMVFEGVSIFDPGQAKGLVAGGHAPDIEPDLSGTHLMRAWTMCRDAYLFWPWWQRRQSTRRTVGLPSAETLTREVMEILGSSRTYFKSYEAALRYPKRQRLAFIRHPTLVCASPDDQLYGFLDEAEKLIPNASKAVLETPALEHTIERNAAIMSGFLLVKI